MYYTGIGSRRTPKDVLEMFAHLGEWLGARGYILRSGGANGADSAFESGCNQVFGGKEIYLPWKGFNNNDSPLYNVGPRAISMAREFHPAWDRLNDAGKLLMARNVYQLFGTGIEDDVGDSPISSFVICYTDGGKIVGGTAQAIRIAQKYDIPVFNAGMYDDIQKCKHAFNYFWKVHGLSISKEGNGV